MNRNHLSILFLLLIVGSLTVGCRKDNAGPTNRGKIYYNDTTYNLTQAFITNYGPMEEGDTIYDFDFDMFSTDMKVSRDTVMGTGNFLRFELESVNRLTPVPGIFKFNKLSNEQGIYNIAFGEFYDSLNFQTGTFVRGDTITSGTVVFTKNGSGIIVTIDCMTKLGKALAGSFAGDATYFDETGKKKKK